MKNNQSINLTALESIFGYTSPYLQNTIVLANRENWSNAIREAKRDNTGWYVLALPYSGDLGVNVDANGKVDGQDGYDSTTE